MENKTCVCVFSCTFIEDENRGGTAQRVHLNAVAVGGGEETDSFAKYTPSGHFEMTVDNPNVAGFFEVGKNYDIALTVRP